MIFVNFKTYSEATGEKAVVLAKICEEISLSLKIEIIPIVQLVDLYRVAQAVQIPVWVQHVDPLPQGQHTGWVNLESVVLVGAKGCLLNHSEHQLPPGSIKQVIQRRDQQFKITICARTLGQAERLAKLKPDYLAYEPPELIGGDLSVSQAQPNVIARIVKKIPNLPIVVGAGVKNGGDIRRALKLGAVGVLVSSGVVLAKNQKEALENLVAGIA